MEWGLPIVATMSISSIYSALFVQARIQNNIATYRRAKVSCKYLCAEQWMYVNEEVAILESLMQ